MTTHQNIYGYVNATLHYACPGRTIVKTRRDPKLLSYFETSPEEIIYRAYWEAYFDGRD
ncbi:MAG TPA: hypothetical protein VNK03_00995 [Gammaproteobacteria bacterium]|nr:hypothetical protein [Gammaproteobacteria bacterium]